MAESPRSEPSYDGHLDLDDLDTDLATRLELLGDDEPRLGDRFRELLERHGVTAWLRTHRLATASTAAIVAIAVVASGLWWAARPAPLPAQPRVLVKVSGPDPTAAIELDTRTGQPVGVRQDLNLTTAERSEVSLALALVGPGLAAPDDPEAYVALSRSAPDDTISGVTARLACATPEDTTAVVGALPADYAVLVRRTAPEGETRVDRVGFIGSAALAQVVRAACLQIAADRDLSVGSVTATALADTVASDLDVVLTNTSPRRWLGLRVSPGASPEITNAGPRADLEPGTSAHVVARLWPSDCADPARSIEAGLPLRPELGPDGNLDGDPLVTPTVRITLPPSASDVVVRALESACGTTVPRLSVESVLVRREPTSSSSAGILDITVRVDAAGASYVEAEAVGARVVGQLAALEFPVRVRDGGAALRLRWTLPGCEAVLRAGRPRLSLTLVGDLRRPYLLDLRGPSIRQALSELCGDEVAAVVS